MSLPALAKRDFKIFFEFPHTFHLVSSKCSSWVVWDCSGSTTGESDQFNLFPLIKEGQSTVVQC